MQNNNVVEVKYRSGWLDHFVNDAKLDIRPNQKIIVEVERGEDIVEVIHTSLERKKLSEKLRNKNFNRIKRIATEEDLIKLENLIEDEKKAFNNFLSVEKKYPFEMKLLKTLYQFDKNRITFFFSAEERIDFRTFVRELASIFRTRIELYQTSGRDQTKWIGGYGMCGNKYCCASWMKHFDQVTIKTAKDQNLSNNLSKVSGPCGRLLCCLNFEEDFYEEKIEHFPEVGEKVYYNKNMMYVYKNDYLNNSVHLASDNTKQLEIVDIEEFKKIKEKNRQYRNKRYGRKKRKYDKKK